jgi:hypothetical protein
MVLMVNAQAGFIYHVEVHLAGHFGNKQLLAKQKRRVVEMAAVGKVVLVEDDARTVGSIDGRGLQRVSP